MISLTCVIKHMKSIGLIPDKQEVSLIFHLLNITLKYFI